MRRTAVTPTSPEVPGGCPAAPLPAGACPRLAWRGGEGARDARLGMLGCAPGMLGGSLGMLGAPGTLGGAPGTLGGSLGMLGTPGTLGGAPGMLGSSPRTPGALGLAASLPARACPVAAARPSARPPAGRINRKCGERKRRRKRSGRDPGQRKCGDQASA